MHEHGSTPLIEHHPGPGEDGLPCGEYPCCVASGHRDAWITRFALLADPTRFSLLTHIHRAGEIRVGDLADLVDQRPATVSQALRLLRNQQIVVTRREKHNVLYRLADPIVHRLLHEAVSP